jgi:hypothetical protein
MLFSERSIWTMLHGIVFGGGALLALGALLFSLYFMYPRGGEAGMASSHARAIAGLTGFAAAALWLTTVVGTYVVFPAYRATPPQGTADLTSFPRAMILADPSTAWLHSFAMETKEHLPFVASMVATAVAFVAWRYRGRLLRDAPMRRFSAALLATTFVIVAYVSLLGVLVNKAAPLQ